MRESLFSYNGLRDGVVTHKALSKIVANNMLLLFGVLDVVITPHPSVCFHPSFCSYFEQLSSETLGPNFFKLRVESSVKRGLKFSTNSYGT